MTSKTIGYARTASSDHDISPQVDALMEAGCTGIFSDVGVCGDTLNRFGLQQLLRVLESGDTLKVDHLDRIAQTTAAFSAFRECLGVRRIRIVLLNGDIETTPALGHRLIMSQPYADAGELD